MKHHTVLCRISTSAISFCNIAVLWGFGLICGRICASGTPERAYSAPGISPLDYLSFFGLVFWQLLPILVVFVASTRGLDIVLSIVIFLRSFCAGISAATVALIYHSAGWLVYRTLFFSDTAASVVFLWLCLKLSAGRTKPSRLHCFCVCIAVFVICIFDFVLISSFANLF